MKAALKASLWLAALMAAAATLIVVWIGARGMSARAEPSRIEITAARAMRRLAMPRDACAMKNPGARPPDVPAQGKAP